jgi:rubrerythrin
MRPIDADELLKHIPPEEMCSRFMVANAPTVEPQRKTGKWIDDGVYGDYHPHHAWHCSECEESVIEIDTPWFKFCPNCGADMRGEKK